MKNFGLKKILKTALVFALVLSAIFVFASCKKEHVHTLGEDEVVTAVTCTTDGVIRNTCTDPECDYYEDRIAKATGHSYVRHPGKDATCDMDGYSSYVTCDNCDYNTFTTANIIVAYGHKLSDFQLETVKPATCTEDGYQDYVQYCTICEQEMNRIEKYVILEALGHVEATVKAKVPTCVEGWDEYTHCVRTDSKGKDICDYTTKVTLPPVYDHNPSLEEFMYDEKAPTCTEDGYYYIAHECTTCGNKCNKLTSVCEHNENCDTDTHNKVVIPALGHDYTSVPAKEATCTDDGWYEYGICNNCGKSTKVVIPKAHSYKHYDYQPATCTADGWEAYDECTVCGYSENKIILPATGHTFKEYHVVDGSVVYATCSSEGSYERWAYCGVCNTEYVKQFVTTPKIDHTLKTVEGKTPTCKEYGWEKYSYCTKCTYTTYNELAPVHSLVHHSGKAVSCTENGYTEYDTCEHCDYTTYQVIPAGHDYNDATGVCSRCSAYLSVGLSYQLVAGTYTVTGIGSCTDSVVVIPSVYNGVAVTAIADGAFRLNESIARVVITDSIVSIGYQAFYKCRNLTSVVIGSGVRFVDKYAFYGCNILSTVEYNGANWGAITFEKYNDPILNATRI